MVLVTLYWIRNQVIAFSIDSGYESFDESDIKSSFEKYYGELLNYTYSTVENKTYKVCIEAQTNQSQIVSYLFEDREDFLEVLYVIDLEAPKSDIERIRKECNATDDKE